MQERDQVIKEQIIRYFKSKNKFNKFLKIMMILTSLVLLATVATFATDYFYYKNQYLRYGSFGGLLLSAAMISSILIPLTASKNNKRVFLENIEFHLDPNSSIESVGEDAEEEIEIIDANFGLNALAENPEVKIKETKIDLSEENPSHLQAKIIKNNHRDHFNSHDDVIEKDLMLNKSYLISNAGDIIRNLTLRDIILDTNTIQITKENKKQFSLLVYKYKRAISK